MSAPDVDGSAAPGQNVCHADARTPSREPFRRAFLARTKLLRESVGLSQSEMAQKLGVPLDRYRKYETRSPMPLFLIEPFAAIVGYSVTFIVTGRAGKNDAVDGSPSGIGVPQSGC
jgi:DNA-binding XRE family transcriptional regulator